MQIEIDRLDTYVDKGIGEDHIEMEEDSSDARDVQRQDSYVDKAVGADMITIQASEDEHSSDIRFIK